MRVVAVLPTRGLIYAKTIQGLLVNRTPYFDPVDDLVIVDGLPIPDCFNAGVQRALEMGATKIWMIEEDNELLPGVLATMVAQGKPIVTADYPVAKGVSHIKRDSNGEILWCGVGNTLIYPEVFDKVGYPWFEANKLFNESTGEMIELSQDKVEKSFGGHDVLFFAKAREQGYTINALEGFKGQHFRAAELPKRETNKGYYTIDSL